jgi:transcriptional regulator with XRE-family HTH domain
MTFGERLRSLREKKGWSQYQLERESGVARPVISRLESGERGREHLSVGVAMRLARTLGVSLDYFVGMYDEEGSKPAVAAVA